MQLQATGKPAVAFFCVCFRSVSKSAFEFDEQNWKLIPIYFQFFELKSWDPYSKYQYINLNEKKNNNN